MYFKTATILAWFFGAYFLLLFAVHGWWLIVPLAVVLGLAMAAIGFNIQHDGGHKAYSERRWVNKVMALTLDLMGGSSYLWDWKHNTLHHTYPNIDGHDDDINVGFLGRLSPQQKRYWFHRLQGIYLWLLYGFLAIKWHFVRRLLQHRHRPHRRAQDPAAQGQGPGRSSSPARSCSSRWRSACPMLLHPWWAVLGVYAIAAFVSGVVLSVVFQLAHCVEEADFPVPLVTADGGERMADRVGRPPGADDRGLRPRQPVLCWFLGGLNFQIEHHLLSKICHVHYPALSKVVEEPVPRVRRPVRRAPHDLGRDRVALPMAGHHGPPDDGTGVSAQLRARRPDSKEESDARRTAVRTGRASAG